MFLVIFVLAATTPLRRVTSIANARFLNYTSRWRDLFFFL